MENTRCPPFSHDEHHSFTDTKNPNPMASTFKWRQCRDYKEMQEIFELVEPDVNVYDRQGIVSRFPNQYKAYTATMSGNNDPFVVAIAIACFLPTTRVLHVETFAIHPLIRRRRLGKQAWQTWRQFIASDWKELKSPIGEDAADTMIEVYLHNVSAWQSIMGVESLDIGDLPAKCIATSTPILVMGNGKLLKHRDQAVAAYTEWQEFQDSWLRTLHNESIRSRL